MNFNVPNPKKTQQQDRTKRLTTAYMKVFNERSDQILHFLEDKEWVSWDCFVHAVGAGIDDGIVCYLKKVRGFVDYDRDRIRITEQGKAFISQTSFVSQRKAAS